MVVMIIFLPCSKLSLNSFEEYAGAMMFLISEKLAILSRICLSNNRLSVTTITESNKGFSTSVTPGTLLFSGYASIS